MSHGGDQYGEQYGDPTDFREMKKVSGQNNTFQNVQAVPVQYIPSTYTTTGTYSTPHSKQPAGWTNMPVTPVQGQAVSAGNSYYTGGGGVYTGQFTFDWEQDEKEVERVRVDKLDRDLNTVAVDIDDILEALQDIDDSQIELANDEYISMMIQNARWYMSEAKELMRQAKSGSK